MKKVYLFALIACLLMSGCSEEKTVENTTETQTVTMTAPLIEEDKIGGADEPVEYEFNIIRWTLAMKNDVAKKLGSDGAIDALMNVDYTDLDEYIYSYVKDGERHISLWQVKDNAIDMCFDIADKDLTESYIGYYITDFENIPEMNDYAYKYVQHEDKVYMSGYNFFENYTWVKCFDKSGFYELYRITPEGYFIYKDEYVPMNDAEVEACVSLSDKLK